MICAWMLHEICQYQYLSELMVMTRTNKTWKKEIKSIRFHQLLFISSYDDNFAKNYLSHASKIHCQSNLSIHSFKHLQYINFSHSSRVHYRSFKDLNTTNLISLYADTKFSDIQTLQPSITLKRIAFYVTGMEIDHINEIMEFLRNFPNLSCVHFFRDCGSGITQDFPFFCKLTIGKYDKLYNIFLNKCEYCDLNK